MKKIYRNETPVKPRKKTKAQLRREWEYTVINGGMVRTSAFPRTAMMLNKGRGAQVLVIGVPLYDDRQMQYLDAIAGFGIMGQTGQEVAATLIMEGIRKAMEEGYLAKLCRNAHQVKKILTKP